ncbi:MAG: hypothetical protein WC284_07760 [Candidimonas sp.]
MDEESFHINQMKDFMGLFESSREREIYNSRRESNKKPSIDQIRRLYEHIGDLNTDDFSTYFSMADSIQLSVAIDNLSEIFRIEDSNSDIIIEMSKPIIEKLYPLNEYELFEIMEPIVDNRGQCIDLYGMIQHLHKSFNSENNNKEKITESVKIKNFDNLIDDMKKLIVEWSSREMTSMECADRVNNLMQHKYGIILKESGDHE